MNRRGVTVIELLIYIVLFIFISLIVGKQFKALTRNYSTGKRVARQQTDTRDVLGIMVREIRNTGLKAYFTGTKTSRAKSLSKAADVIVETGVDSSSFAHVEQSQGTFNDRLTIRKIRLNSSGTYEATEKIEYYVDGTTLMRELATTEQSDTLSSVVAQNVYGLQFHYGVTGIDTLIYDDDPINPVNWTVISGSGTKTNGTDKVILTFTGATSGAIKCSHMRTVTGNCRYTVHVRAVPSNGFLEELDSMRFAFKYASTYFGAESFKPHMTDMGFSFKTTSSGSANMLLEYEVKGAGSIVIAGIRVFRSGDSTFTWKTDPTVDEKPYVKAIRMFVLIRSAGAAEAVSAPKSLKVGNLTFTPPEGNYLWRVHEETIEVPNNGIF